MTELVHPPGTLDPRDPSRRHTFDYSTKLADALLPFGVWVVRGAGPERAALPTSADDVTTRSRGLVIQHTDPVLGGPVIVGIEAGDPCTLLRRGSAWVHVEHAVSQDAQPYVRFAAGPGGTQLGALRADSDAGTAAPLPRARFATDGRRCALLTVNL